MKTLFKNAEILYHTDTWETMHHAWLGVENDRIIYMGIAEPQDTYDSVINMYDHLLIPGLYNLHSHSAMTCLRGKGSNLPLSRWLFDEMLPIEHRMNEEDVNVSSRIALLELIASGVAGFSDMSRMAFSSINEMIHCGLRVNVCCAITSVPEGQEDLLRETIAESTEMFHQYNGCANGRIQIDFAIHAEYTSVAEQVRLYSDKCKELGTHMELHLSESRKEHEECKVRHGITPTRYFYDLGVFDNPTIAAHCVWVEPDDIRILKEKRVSVVHNPTSNMKLGSGFIPMRTLLDQGICVTLGTDGSASNNNQNMFEELHVASLINCGYSLDPTVVTTTDLMNMVTLNGAAAQGRADCGNLCVGGKADIVAINLDKPHLIPDHDNLALLTYSAQASDVSMNMVDGKILYRDGEYLTMDYEKAKYDMRKSVERLF